MSPKWQDYVTPPPDIDWKLLLMKILNCFGLMHDDWYEQYWAKFGVTREEGKRIVEEYEKYQQEKAK
jgi:hypothetical protein|tara:strand:- start:30 stop:230 length:201 start_codon:yes stop_codon:yes gene_type:complete